MIKFIQLSFLLGGIGVITNEQVTNTSVASTMMVVPTTSSPSITAAKTLGVPTTLLPTNTEPRKNFDLTIWILIGVCTAILLLFLILLARGIKRKQLERKRKDKSEVQPLTKNDDISLHRTVHQEDDIKVTAMSNFSEEVLVHSTSAVPNKGVISSKVDSLEQSGSKSKYFLSNYNSVALENEDNPMCTLKEDLCKTDDKDPKRTYEKEDVQRSTPERDVSVGMSLRKTSTAKNVLDEYDPVITYGPTNAGSRFRSGSILGHPHNNLNSIAEDNEQITVSEDGTAKLAKEQDNSFPCDSVVSTNPSPDRSSYVGEMKEIARSYSIGSGPNVGSRYNSTNSQLSDVGENVRLYSTSSGSGSNIGSRCNSTNSKLSDSDISENVRSYSTSSGSNIGSRCNSTNSRLNDSGVGENDDPDDSILISRLLAPPLPDVKFESKNTRSKPVSSSDATTSLSHAKRFRKKRVFKFYNNDDTAKKTRANLAKKLITTDGGVIKLKDVILRINAGCLDEDTEITLRIDDQRVDRKSLFDLGLIKGASNVVEFLPNGLKFLKPADLMFKHERTVSDIELFILRGSYNCNYWRTVWELVAGDIAENTKEGFVNAKIEGFSFYFFISATRGMLASLLSHLNYSFSCYAYALYRRKPAHNELIDILVVLVSEFVDDKGEENIKQLKDLYQAKYIKSEKGTAKRLGTDRRLQMCLDFQEYKGGPFSFFVDQGQLDSIGYVIDHFKGVPIKYPAKGTITIHEVLSEENSAAESGLPWVLRIDEEQQNAKKDEIIVQPIPTDTEPPGESAETEVVRRNTKLTTIEITRVSRMVAMDWDSLAGLMDIPYEKREEIRTNFTKYPDSPSKAEEVLEHFNGSDCFGRDILEKCVDELGRHDLLKKLQPMKDENKRTGIVRWKKRIPSSQIKEADNEEIKKLITRLENSPEENVQPLSPREMYRLSRCVGVDWDSLAGLMDIAKEERDDIRYNFAVYSDHRSRAEKILSIFNRKRDFSRKKLVECLKEIRKLDVIRPIITGKWKVM
ncbi:uncharacterized protein LOC114527037 [Dendronephthya gigantea]|uniref:uncharacterized protein LOC114527037 n=1 Tax=Dendronephthya gigantea TaxID=151771 RepID=UPI00106A2269|nr:uncharacterized protein LOC114527037 [Dendronephthya gigantea]